MFSGCCGCLGLLTLLIGGGGVWIASLVQRSQRRPGRERFNHLLMQFCSGEDQSLAQVNRIRQILLVTFADDSEHEELAAAVATFAPGGQPPFHDEAWLEEKFRAYLRGQGITVPDYGKEQPGVWPPPPNWRG